MNVFRVKWVRGCKRVCLLLQMLQYLLDSASEMNLWFVKKVLLS